MKKKMIALLVVLFWWIGTPAMAAEAFGNNTILLVNQQAVEIYPYNISGNNYFKLRDMAAILTNTENQFCIDWNESAALVELKRGTAYDGDSTTCFPTGETVVEAIRADVSILMEEKHIVLTGYNIGGNNYIKIRDLAELIGGQVIWNESTQLMEWNSDCAAQTTSEEVPGVEDPAMDKENKPDEILKEDNTTGEFSSEQMKQELHNYEDMDLSERINTASLTPKLTNFAAINDEILAFMDENFNEDMDTYTKVKTAYDYFIDNMTYGTASALDMTSFSASEAGIIWQCYPERYVLQILRNHVGVCNHYSCAYGAILRAIGLDVEIISGKTYAAGGGFSNHVWVEVIIDGIHYVFDPQVEQNITRRNNGTILYNRFGKPMEEVTKWYQDGTHYRFSE